MRFVWLDLQDRGRIQKELSNFELDLANLGEAKILATRIKQPSGGKYV